MAITYHAGRRIQGLSTEGITTPTYETDFSSSTGWTATGSNVSIDTSASYQVMDFNIPNSTNVTDAISYDLTSASDSAWVLRFKLTMSNYSQNSTGHAKKMCIGLSSASHSTAIESSQDAIGILFGSWDNGTHKIRSRSSDGGSWMDGSGTDFTESFTDDEVYYVEIKRTSTTAYTVSLYSDSSYSTLIETENETIDSTVTGLRYLKVGVDTTTGAPDGTFAGQIDDMKFYNGVTTATTVGQKPTNVQAGSRFEETDTRKMYNLKEQPTPESTATYQVTDTSGTQTLYQNFSQAYISAQKVGSGSVLVGKRVSKLELHLYRVGSPTGTATVGVWNGSGELQYTFGTIDVSTITTATNATLYTFNNTDSTHVFSANEYFGISYNTGGDGSNKIAVYHDDASPPFDGTNSVWSRYNGSSWTDFTAVDNSFKLYLATEGGTMVWQEIGT